MNKLFDFFQWKNEPDTSTPLTAENLNKINNALDDIDDRVIEIRSHVGQIIMSTTLATEEQVIAMYGGSLWEQIQGMFLLGASSNYSVGTTGGEATHTLTVNEMPSHEHRLHGWAYLVNSGQSGPYACSVPYSTYDNYQGYTYTVGGNQPHNNMPPYKVVYIWERKQ